jgi:hypothetical protein
LATSLRNLFRGGYPRCLADKVFQEILIYEQHAALVYEKESSVF